MPTGPVAFEYEDAGAEHDGHVGDIENSSPQGANPNVHEVDHHSISDPIQEVGGTTGYEQSRSKESPSRPAPPPGDYGQGNQEQPVPNTEHRCSDGTWPVCAET